MKPKSYILQKDAVYLLQEVRYIDRSDGCTQLSFFDARSVHFKTNMDEHTEIINAYVAWKDFQDALGHAKAVEKHIDNLPDELRL